MGLRRVHVATRSEQADYHGRRTRGNVGLRKVRAERIRFAALPLRGMPTKMMIRMTKRIHTLAHEVQARLLAGPWPPKQRVLVDAWAALIVWRAEGEHVFRLRAGVHAPPIPPDLRLVSAPLRKAAVCYILPLRGQWMILARVPAQYPLPVRSPERTLAFRQPLLCYATVTESGSLASGHINLWDQPSPRDVKIIPGTTRGEIGARKMETEEISEESIRLAQVLPWFFGP